MSHQNMLRIIKTVATHFSLIIIFVVAVDLTFRKYILLSPDEVVEKYMKGVKGVSVTVDTNLQVKEIVENE